MSEVLKRLFSSDLQERLFPDNSFYAGCQADAAAVDVDTIEIPQDEDGDAASVVNPQKLPLPMNIEEDKKLTYGADLLATLPTVVTYQNQLLTSYDKRAAKMRKHQRTLEAMLADRIMYGWAPTVSNFIKLTTGGTTRAATAPSATGTRKVAIDSDIMQFMTLFNRLNIPNDGRRRMVVSPEFLEDIINIKKSWGQGSEQNNDLLEKGAVAQIFTFNVYVRSRTTVYDNTSTKKAVGSAGAAGDSLSAIFYHPDFVRYVKGTNQVNMDPAGRPELLGGMSMNVLLRGGGTSSRLSQTGVGALVQGT